MYYKDLTFYRFKGIDNEDIDDENVDGENMYSVFTQILNIGWLDNEHPFPKGEIPVELLHKLKEITFADLVISENKKAGLFDKNKALQVHCMHMRAPSYHCPFCPVEKNKIWINRNNLSSYFGDENFLTGCCLICIPSKNKEYFYIFPSMLHHYIEEHKYLPPSQFLDALQEFNINKPFNVFEEIDDSYREISLDELQEMDSKVSVCIM